MPPVAEKASRFRGNTPIGRRKASGNRQVRRCLRIASRQNDGCCGIFELPSPRGERDEAPPVAEEASRFRGSTPIGRREAAVNRQVRRCLRIASERSMTTTRRATGCRPREGCGLHPALSTAITTTFWSCRPREGCGLHLDYIKGYLMVLTLPSPRGVRIASSAGMIIFAHNVELPSPRGVRIASAKGYKSV